MFDDFEIPTDFSSLTDERLDELEKDARSKGKPLAEKVNADEELTDDEQAGITKLAEVVTKAKTERERRIGDAADKAKKTSDNKKAADLFKGDEKETPAPEAEKVTRADVPGVAAVAANGGVVNGNGGDADDNGYSSRMVAAANLPQTQQGHVFKNISDLAKTIERQFSLYPRGPASGRTMLKNPVMYLERTFPEELRITERTPVDQAMAVFDHAGSVDRVGRESLVAAAGWCAPSQIDYSLLELETRAGLLDLPEVQIARGGIQFTTGPDFASIWGGSGFFHQTEAQVIAATTKPCMVVPCPSFTEKRLEVDGVCLTGSFLQDRGYPEMVARFTRGVLTAHAHKLNVFKINQLVAGSTLFDYTNVANVAATTPEAKDLTVLSRLLAFVGIQIMDLRYKYRMAEDAMIEAVMPYWVIEQVRADVQRRTGLDLTEAFNVSVAQIRSWFAVRGARVQFVYDWLDTYNTTNTSTVGQTAGIYTLPTTVDVLLYPAGTWVAGVADVVRLDTVYDSTNLALNQYVQLFTEEGILVAKRGYESRRVRATISPSGATAATVDMRNG